MTAKEDIERALLDVRKAYRLLYRPELTVRTHGMHVPPRNDQGAVSSSLPMRCLATPLSGSVLALSERTGTRAIGIADMGL